MAPPQLSIQTELDDGHASKILSGSSTPSRIDHRSSHNKRKQTLLTLLDALTELKLDEEKANFGHHGAHHIATPERKIEGPTVDEQLQIAGAEAFAKFQRRMNSLDKELRNFANATRQLGSSVGILSSAHLLRERLAQVLFLFRENAADLFPRKVSHQARETVKAPEKIRYLMKEKTRMIAEVARASLAENLDAEDFPEQMELFAKDVITFLKSLNEFPEFQDEAVNVSISSFEADLKYWASCLKTYEEQFKYPAVQRYLHDLTSEMGEHLDTITMSLNMFLEIGIPTIRFAQKHAASNLLNLSTVATFFSAVTATTLQFSFQATGNSLSDAVNGFWFCSLVFSIASAVNSLLGLTWKQAMYRSPGHRVPWWVSIWIKRSPLVFLVVSVAAFSIGLCLFAYSSNQHPVTAALTTVFTGFSSFGLIAVSAWFVFERWTFTRHRGQKWLMDVLLDLRSKICSIPPIIWMTTVPPKKLKRAATFTGISIRRAGTTLTRVHSFMPMREKPSDPDCILPVTISPESLTPNSPAPSPGIQSTLNAASGLIPTEIVESPIQEVPTIGTPSANRTIKRRFASAVRSVMTLQQAATNAVGSFPISPRRQRTQSSGISTDSSSTEPISSIRVSRVAALIPILKSLTPTQDLPPHQALVRHLQFSPNGTFLASCSWDRTCVIFRVGEPFTAHRILAHPQGFVGQVAWSPDGCLLLTKMARSIKVWASESGVCRKTIVRHRDVQSITWFPGGEAFMSVEGSVVTKLDVNGNVIGCFEFDHMKLHDVAVMIPKGGGGSQRLLCVATLLASADGLQPSKSRAEKRIIVYNLDRKEIENQVPVLYEVRDITLAKNGKDALVSYENKAPPQLWRVEMVKDRHNEQHFMGRLMLRHTYMPKTVVDFAGPSYFGGKDDQLIFCAGKAGDIHIWDRESGALLQHFPAQDLEGDLTCIAWNHASTAFMFSTGSHDGGVKIWTTPVTPTPNILIQKTASKHNALEFPRAEIPSLFNWSSESIHRSESPVDEEFPDEATEYSSADHDGTRMLSDRRTITFQEIRSPS